ncbi:MAG TPA: nucleotidyltransferase family protein [Verrucomicrobiae bacterium]|nr:nucleotidyltransferase family protein [Verrucomicrobiae bacterium]
MASFDQRKQFDMNISRSTRLIPRNEDALLLACAVKGAEKEKRETVRRLVSQCTNWDYVVEAARHHGITALVTSSLERRAADIVPRKSSEILSRRFRANAARNLFLTRELLLLIREFGAHGINVIPFKGPVLAITAYGNVALREFLDLDILVQKEHIVRAGQLLTQWGYQQPVSQTSGGGSSHVESQLGCDFWRKDGRVSVELHWSFIQRWLGFQVDLEAVWRTPPSVPIGGMNVLSLPAETMLLYLCAHGTKHRWRRLCWVVDIAQVMEHEAALDWDKLLKTSKHMGSRRTFFLGLRLAHFLLGVELPHKVWLEMEKDPTSTTLAQKICADIFSSEPAETATAAGWSKDWFYLRAKERWQDRLRYLRYLAGWLLLPSQKDRRWIPLPASLRWLYIVLRPIRVACSMIRPRSRARA